MSQYVNNLTRQTNQRPGLGQSGVEGQTTFDSDSYSRQIRERWIRRRRARQKQRKRWGNFKILASAFGLRLHHRIITRRFQHLWPFYPLFSYLFGDHFLRGIYIHSKLNTCISQLDGLAASRPSMSASWAHNATNTNMNVKLSISKKTINN